MIGKICNQTEEEKLILVLVLQVILKLKVLEEFGLEMVQDQ